MTQLSPLADLEARLTPLRSRLLEHEIYTQIGSVRQLQAFMEHHVFAVWDFMSLLKALQTKICCNTVPWLPPKNRLACRLVNEIVLAEESDIDSAGNFASHFDQYCQAMQHAGADTSCIGHFISRLQNGVSVKQALFDPLVPGPAREFVLSSFTIIDSDDSIALAGAFTYGREELLPRLFQRIVDELSRDQEDSLTAFRYYLHRHVELDGDNHGPMAKQMLSSLCGHDEKKWQRVEQAALSSLEARIALWDGFSVTLKSKSPSSESPGPLPKI
ncbi:MAG: DUF3050 domain-containing protein [Pirellulaceae bacterium]|nr:DUF3050 domain-containing protein [Pirellulaceae bacterium]